MRRTPWRLAAATAFVTLAAAAPASAVSFSVGASIQGSGCTSQTSKIAWFGGFPSNGIWPSAWPHGSAYVCWYKYRLNDSDPNGDYYAMVATSNWTYSSGARNYPAYMSHSISSDRASKDSVYSSTGTFTSSSSCSTAFSVSFGAGPVSASVTPKLCSSYKVTRRSFSGTGAFWDSPSAGGLTKVETAFVQKVANGAVPHYTATFAIPQYVNTWYANSYWQTSSHLVYQTFSNK
jgi:hypothetical protein